MINQKGTKKDIILNLRDECGISTKEANTIITYLETHKGYLSDNEYINVVHEYESNADNSDGYMNLLLTDKQCYYINIKKTTIILIATILDISLTLGFANGALALSGMSTKAIAKLEDARLCVVKEVKLSNNTAKYENLSQICDRECINNDMDCCHRINGYCTLSKTNLKELVIPSLLTDGILKEKNGCYYYQF